MEDSDIQKMGDMFTDPVYNKLPESKPIIMAIGVGGGGGNAVNHMYRQGIKDVRFVLVNTDLAALNNSPVPEKVLIGSGLGAGAVPEVARDAAEADIDKIESIFSQEIQMVFVTAGMGGGTGTGAGPVVARVARERGLLTIGIVTIPFLFEGERKILKALDGAEEMAKYVDALLVINNERLAEIYGDLDFMNAFGKADDTLTIAARSISEIITSDGYTNLDFRDVNSTLRDSGAAIISTGYGEGEDRLQMAIHNALHSPLLGNHDVLRSKKLLLNLTYSRKAKKPFLMHEINAFTKFTKSIPGVDVIFGMQFDDTLEDRIKLTVLAAGFDVTIRESESPEKQGEEKTDTLTFSPKGPKKPEGTATGNKIEAYYGENASERYNKYAILTMDQLDDEEIIDLLENIPAAMRSREDYEKFNTQTEAAPGLSPENKSEATRTSQGGLHIGF